MKIHLPLPLRALIVPIGISACLQTNRVYAAAQPPSDVPLVGFKNPASYPVLTSLVFTSYGSGTASPAATRISLSGTSFFLAAGIEDKGLFDVIFRPAYSATYSGQAIQLDNGSSLMIENLNTLGFYAHNHRQPYNTSGSAIKATDSSVMLRLNTSVIFDNNHAPNGAGGAIAAWDSPVTLSLNGRVIFSNNSCGNTSGGAIYHHSIDNANNDSSPLSVSQNAYVEFSSNTASNGGAIQMYDCNLRITDNGILAFLSNEATQGSGGAINSSGKTIIIFDNKDITFSANKSTSDGGAISGTLALNQNDDVKFSKNFTKSTGGAIYASPSSLSSILENGKLVFEENASTESGGAIRCSNLDINHNGTILWQKNTSGKNGGAIATSAPYAATLNLNHNERIEFTKNTAVESGGAIHSFRSDVNLSDNGFCSFLGNTSGKNGGAIFLDNSGYHHEAQIRNNNSIIFDSNTTQVDGGAIRLSGSTLMIKGNNSVIFSNNSAGNLGGAINFNFDLSIIDNKSTVFRGNYVKTPDGAALNAIYQASPYTLGELELAANDGQNITFYDPITLDSEAPVVLNAYIPEGADTPTVATGTIVLSGEHTAVDLEAILARESLNPDAATRERLLAQSRLTSVKGETTLYGGTFLVKENAVYQGSNYQTEAGSITHLRNGGLMNFQQKAVFAPGSTLIVSGVRPVGLSAASVSMQGATLEFRLSGTGSAPLLTLTGNADLSGATFNLLADNGHTTLSSGTYTLLQINGDLSQTSSIALNLVGITADKSELVYNPETKTWTWTSENITVEKPADPDEPGIAGDPEETPGTPDTPGDPGHPQNADIPAGLADASINTLWASTQNLDSFSGILRNHSTRISLDTTGRSAVWFDTIGNFYRQSSNGTHAGYDYSAWGAALGGEYQVEPHLQIGAGLGHTFGKNTTKLGYGRIDQDTLLGGAYANIRLMQQQQHSLWLSTTGAFGIARNHGTIASPDLPGIGMRGSWDETVWQLDMRLAWSYAVTQSTAVYAFAGIQYATGKQDAFTLPGENGDYRFTGNSLNRTRIPIGIGIRHNLAAWSFMADASVIPDIARTNPAARIQDAQSNHATVRGVDPGRCAFEFNLGAAYSLTDNWSLTAGYGITTTGDTVQQNARIGTSYAF